jgi:bifunctional DNA-binding transcriptional regulator/antitoxin component of YhaV-PrlF toxin-antitoxin module
VIRKDGSDGAALCDKHKERTTIPQKGQKALRVKPGDKLQYDVNEDRATVRVHAGFRSLKGALASKKGQGMSFAEIRDAAAKAVCPR